MKQQLNKLMKLILKKHYLCIIFLILAIYLGLIFISGIILEQFTWGDSVTFHNRCFAILIVCVIIVTGCGVFFFTRKIFLFLYGLILLYPVLQILLITLVFLPDVFYSNNIINFDAQKIISLTVLNLVAFLSSWVTIGGVGWLMYLKVL